MTIPTKQQKEAQDAASKSAFAKECSNTFNRLDADSDALASYGLNLKIESSFEGLSLVHGSYELGTLRISGASQFEILLNDYLNSESGELQQQEFNDPVAATQAFEAIVPKWVEEFESKRNQLSILGLI